MASDANDTITFTEVDEVNNPTATYIYSGVVDQSTHLSHHDKNNSKPTGRLDVIVCIYFMFNLNFSYLYRRWMYSGLESTSSSMENQSHVPMNTITTTLYRIIWLHWTAWDISFYANTEHCIMHSIDNVQHPSSKPQSWSLSSLTSLLVEVFLPAGYPHSVSDDYVP